MLGAVECEDELVSGHVTDPLLPSRPASCTNAQTCLGVRIGVLSGAMMVDGAIPHGEVAGAHSLAADQGRSTLSGSSTPCRQALDKSDREAYKKDDKIVNIIRM